MPRPKQKCGQTQVPAKGSTGGDVSIAWFGMHCTEELTSFHSQMVGHRYVSLHLKTYWVDFESPTLAWL